MKYFSAVAFLAITTCFAQPYNDGYYHSSNNASSHEEYPAPIQNYQDPHLEERIITPNASPVVRNGVDVFVFADYLYWTAREEYLAYAITGLPSDSDRNDFIKEQGQEATNTPQGKSYYVNPKFDSGFKAGIGFDMGHDGWDLMGIYTWFRTKQKEKLIGENALGKRPIATIPPGNLFFFDDDDLIGESRASWSLHFNVADLSLGRNYFISPFLTLRPHIGLKGTWQKQQFHASYLDIFFREFEFIENEGEASETITGYFRSKYEQKYWGVGVRGGLESFYMFNQNFGVFGNFSLATLWGQFQTSTVNDGQQTITQVDIDETTVTTIPPSVVLNSKDRFHSINCVFELEIGLRYDVWFSDNDYRFRIQAGWENQLWLSQNQSRQFLVTAPVSGNLGLQGLNAQIRFDF